MKKFAARPISAFLACMLAGFAVYWPALAGELVWDDTYLVSENPFFKSPVFGWEVFQHWLFFDSFSTYYRPVQNLSYILDYWLWRGAPFGYHLTNILLHSLSGFLLCMLLRRLLPPLLREGEQSASGVIALLVALVWAVHPIHNAAVAYISGRADSLASVFALSAWLLAIRARATGRIAFGVLASVAALLALCSKEIALVWLALFVGHSLAFERGLVARARVAQLATAAIVLGIYAWLHSLPEARVPMEDAPPAPLPARALLMLRALGDYASLIVYPGKLYMERTISDLHVLRSAQSWREHVSYEYLSVLGLFAALGAIHLCRGPAPGWRVRRLGACWFLLAFLPISNLFPLNADVAEHWIYLASVGALLLMAGSVLALSPRGQAIALGFVAVAIPVLCVRTAVRAGDWVGAETFCQRTIAAGGASPRVLATLAAIYAQRGELLKQERLLRRTIERFPEFTPARIHLGICLQRQGRNAEASTLLELGADAAAESARRFPRTWPAALQLARLRTTAGHPDEALAILRAARARFPATWELAQCEAEILGPEGRPIVERFAAGHWWHLGAWLALGEARAASGDTEGALAALTHAARLDLYDPRPHATIARLEWARRRGDAALDAQCSAIRRQREQAGSYFALAAILHELGRRADAESALRRAQILAASASAPVGTPLTAEAAPGPRRARPRPPGR